MDWFSSSSRNKSGRSFAVLDKGCPGGFEQGVIEKAPSCLRHPET